MRRLNRPNHTFRFAFTLVELLVAVSVVTLLVALVSQLLARATAVTTDGIKRMDANDEAQTIFSRMAIDFSGLVKRADIDYYLQKKVGNDQLAFFSLTTGYYPDGVSGQTATSPLCLAGYRIRNHRLERLGKALIWNGVTDQTQSVSTLPADAAPMVFSPQTITGTWPTIQGAGNDVDYQVISDQVYRFEYRFLLKNGALSDTPYLGTSIDGMKDVTAIVVAIALLDTKSRLMVSDLGVAAPRLPDPVGTDPILKAWQNAFENGDLGLPNKAASQVRFFQRFFFLSSSP